MDHVTAACKLIHLLNTGSVNVFTYLPLIISACFHHN